MRFALADARLTTRGDDYWIAPNAIVIGSVILEKDASIWWNTVVRGDNEPITVGEGSNVQDGCVLHTDPGCPLTIGRGVTLGHLAMLHGCLIGDNSLIGIGATVLNGARIGNNCAIGAHSFVPEGREFPDNSLVFGSPARVVRQLKPEEVAGIGENAAHYVENWKRYRAELRPDD